MGKLTGQMPPGAGAAAQENDDRDQQEGQEGGRSFNRCGPVASCCLQVSSATTQIIDPVKLFNGMPQYAEWSRVKYGAYTL